MVAPVTIESAEQLQSLLSSSTIVVTDFHATWCGPCRQIAPVYQELAARWSRPNHVTFTKVDVDAQPEIARTYEVTSMPTFMIFKNGQEIDKIIGADPRRLSKAVRQRAEEGGESGGKEGGASTSKSAGAGNGSGSGGSTRNAEGWRGAEIPKGYSDITKEIEKEGLDILNVDSDLGSAHTLFADEPPSALLARQQGHQDKGKASAAPEATTDGSASTPQADWVESDTDEQIMLFMPFRSGLKVHSLHLTSLPPPPASSGTTIVDPAVPGPMRPKTVNVYSNRAHVLGFDEAEDIPATQTIVLTARDWDPATGTAKVELRFVKFQNVTSLVLFVVDGDGDGDEDGGRGEKVRLDRVRIMGEVGNKREVGKMEKFGDEPGE
ncbi:MAG: hypothetical protein M1826_001675 [Phylliscum demangeonii]|nr:MAG: hypothetical protein M1826_001675 [Phylliscum demangeonii]